MRPFFVYMIRCGDGSFYVGHTDDLEQRWGQHLVGVNPGCHTYARRPLHLVFVEELASRDEAFARERQLKGWTRAKKLALARNDWDALHLHARSRAAAPR